MNSEDSSVGPVHYEKRPFVFVWIIAFRPELYSGRRADADIDNRRETVGVIFRPLRAALAKSVVAAADDVHDPDRPVPRHAPIPFHVAVEAEQFAVGVERDVVGVAEAGGEIGRAHV